MAEMEKDFLLERIRQLQDANRRWKMLALANMTALAVLSLVGLVFVFLLSHSR